MSRQRTGLRIAFAAALCIATLCVVVLPLVAEQIGRTQPAEEEIQTRWALVIGNADYATGELLNPVNDARDVAQILHDLGFAVDLRENVGHQAMEDAVRAFGRRLEEGQVGLFYFAGHGVQLHGENFLIPVGTKIVKESEIPYKAVDLGFLLDHMGESPDRLNIVILDACRDNPFRGRLTRSFTALGQGLAQTKAPTGTIIAYATAPGQVAADGTGRNGIFTSNLLSALRLAGLTIEEVFKRTRQAVVKETSGLQVPWTSSSLLGDFVPRPQPPGGSDIKVARMEDPRPPDFSRKPPAPPRRGRFSLEEIDGQAEAYKKSHQAWSEHLDEMKGAYEEVDLYEERRDVPVHLKAQAWQLFLESFSENNPYSQVDNSLRAEATAHRDLWSREASRIEGHPILASYKPLAIEIAPLAPESETGERWRDPVSGTDFRYVRSGSFRMGSPRFEEGRQDNETQHQVTLNRGFWIAETEVTQRQWEMLLGGNPSYFADCGDDCPVERVSWYEAVSYANLLSDMAGVERCYELAGCRGSLGGGCSASSSWCFGDFTCLDASFKGPSCEGYRLPTEAEWEYAARAGTKSSFWTGESLSLNQANFYDGRFQRLRSNRSGTVETGSFGANPWGLHDVHGNVLEWVWDFFGNYSVSETEDPCGPWDGTHRVARGGSWEDAAELVRTSSRRRIDAGNRFHDVGFRLARTTR